jgi:amino acid transporter
MYSYTRIFVTVFGNAIFPNMFVDYLTDIIPGLDNVIWRLIAVFITIAFSLYCNWMGLEAVGWICFVLSFIILIPFILFFIFAATMITPSRIFAPYPKNIGKPNIVLLLSTISWQYSGFDLISTFSAETKNPSQTSPRAMIISIILIIIVYLLPPIAGVSIEPDLAQLKDASFSSIAKKLPHCENG